jgi:hypothetical protein
MLTLLAVTPPGHFTASGTTAKCPAGTFRAEWAVGTSAASCTPCGTAVLAKDNSQIVQYSTAFPYVATSIGVADSSSACCEYPAAFWLWKLPADASARTLQILVFL